MFDTETLPGPAQQLRFLVWRLYRDQHGREPASTCIEEGIAYPDELDASSLHLLREFSDSHSAETTPGFPSQLQLRPLSWWLEQRLFRYGYAHRDRCTVVGFNLLFDLGRLARYWAPAAGSYRGGYSLGFWGDYDETGKWRDRKHRGRLRLRAIDPRRTLFSWAARIRNDPDQDRGPGRFVDLRTLTFALTDRSHTLETACAAFGDPYRKHDVDYQHLTPELIGYALEDVRHTATLYRNCLTELRRHEGIPLEPHRLYSPATVGTRYLEALGVRRPLVKFTRLSGKELGWDEPASETRRRRSKIEAGEPRGDLDPAVLGFAMSAFYGGRAEASIVRTPVPVVLVDFTSMYPSVNALLGTWRLLIADQLSRKDVTQEVRRLLGDGNLLERCLEPELWRQLGVTLVEVEPAGAVLPTRARYDPTSTDFGIGVNPLSYEGRLWYALPDLIAAVLLTPAVAANAPLLQVKRALRLTPIGTQRDLKPVQLRGGKTINPITDDPFVHMIEERQRVLRDHSLNEAERNRLERFLKITANATAYGVLARFDRREQSKPTAVTVYGPDQDPANTPTPTPEDPGPFCFPPVAATITAGARLMLALLERLVVDAGGRYAFCDTDSMAIVATREGRDVPCATPDGSNTIRALRWSAVESILARFNQLNPYDPALVASPWKVEADSLTRELYCYAISAKRYCLYHLNEQGTADVIAASDQEGDDESAIDGEQQLEDWSEHGLGLYLDPTTDNPDRPRRDAKGRRAWVAEAWQWILNHAHGGSAAPPAWSDAYALTRFTVSTPRIQAWFKGHDATHPEEAIRPGSFGLIAHPATLGTPRSLPAATYETDPARWPELEWYDRRSGKPIKIIARPEQMNAETRSHALTSGSIPITTLGDVLTRYSRHPEHKSVAPDEQPAGRETHGLLRRRPVTSSPHETELIGKEGNKIEERISGYATDGYRNSYGPRESSWQVTLSVLQEIGAPEAAREAHLSRSSVYAVLNGAQPHPDRRIVYEQLATRFARQRLSAWDAPPPAETTALLSEYLAQRNARGEDLRRCAWDGTPIPTDRRADARFCSNRCRRAAHRALASGAPA